jgi:hypothetical protein
VGNSQANEFDARRAAFLEFVLSKDGLPYCWPTEENRYSGKDLRHAKYKDCYDCSGLVTAGLYHASGGKLDWRSTTNAYRLMHLLPETHEPRPGDLAFYGPGRNLVNHVMIVLGEKDRDLQVYGACGGNSYVTSPDIARAKGARVRTRKSHTYRPDFLGFTRLFKEDAP